MYDDLPARMQDLPRDKHGRPVPWFVAWIDGKPDFRVIGPRKIEDALRGGLCWVCGYGFRGGEDRAFVIGPMCTINRVSAEPPSHIACAVWSAENCPFLSTPSMVRRERNLPEGVTEPAGNMITRNPGATAVWITGYRGFKAQAVDDGGLLFRIGDPKEVLWFAEGRATTRAEVMTSINTGLPLLTETAEKDGPDAVEALAKLVLQAMTYIPKETTG